MNVIKNKVLPITICILILMSCLVIPAFAYPVIDNNYTALCYYTISNNQHILYAKINGTPSADAYACITLLGNYQYLRIVSTRNQPIVFNDFYNNSDHTTVSNMTIAYNSDNTDSNYYTEFRIGYNDISITSELDTYNQSTYTAYEINKMVIESSLANPQDINCTLPAGNALIIEYTGTSTYNMKTVSTAPTIQVAHGLNGIKVGYTSTIPDIVAYDDSYLSETDFTGYGSTNVFGQYTFYEKSGSFGIEAPSGAKYFVIMNSLWGFDTNNMVANPSITVTATNIKGYWIYPLNTQMSGGGWINESGDDVITYEYDEDTQEWIGTDQNGNPANPTVGGVNILPQAKTVTEWLENIVDTLTDFFKGPINAINVLIQNLSGFVNSLKSLYMWLPTPVYSLLTSAIMVAITIGVIKIFI